MVARRAAAARRPPARRRARGPRRSRPRRPPRAPPPTCPGRSASSCRRRSSRPAPRARPGPPARGLESPGWAKTYGTTRSCPGSRGSPARLPVAPRAREVVEQRGVVHGEQRVVGLRLGVDERAPAPASAARIALGARGRARCPGMRTPTQTSPPGSWSRWRVAPDDGHREGHGGASVSRRARSAARHARPAACATRPADRRARARARRLDRRRRGRRRRPRHRGARRARAARRARRRAHGRDRDHARPRPRRCTRSRWPRASPCSTARAR